MKRLIVALGLAAVLPLAVHAGPTEIDYPGATRTFAYAYDASDNVVAGTYYDSHGVAHGYIYDTRGRTYTPFDVANSSCCRTEVGPPTSCCP